MRERIRPYVLPVAVAVAIVACLYTFSPNFRYSSGPTASPYGGDFLQEWLGGWIVRAGDHTRFYDVAYAASLQHDESLVGFAWNEDEYLPIVYPPFYYLVISPLSRIPVHAAAWIWAGLMTAALVGSVALLARQFWLYDGHSWPSMVGQECPPYETEKLLPWMIPAAAFFAPVLESLSSSQKGTLCLLIFTATFVLWQRGRAFTAGMLFGLIAFKPQMALVIFAVAIWKRQWRFLGGMATTGVVLLALSLCVGVDVCWQYVQFASGTGEYMQTSGYDLFKSHSIWGFAQLLMPHADDSLRVCFSLLMAALVVYQLARIFKGDPVRRADCQSALPAMGNQFALQYSALVIATVLLSPHLFTYDLTILLLPMALVLLQQQANPSAVERRSRWLIALLFISPAVSTALANATGVQITVPLMLALLSQIANTGEESVRVSEARVGSPKLR